MSGGVFLLVVIGGFCAAGLSLVLAVRLVRRRRWRDDVRPRVPRAIRSIKWESEGPAWEDPDPADPAVARWGATENVPGGAYVRAFGQLRWHQATVFLVGGGTGLVVDPYLAWNRRYVFDGTCHVGPTDAVMTFNPGGQRLKDFRTLRIADATQRIELAVMAPAMARIELIGCSEPAETAGTGADDARRRTAWVQCADRMTMRRRAFFAAVNAQTKVRRWAGAAVALVFLGFAEMFSWISDYAQSHGPRALEALGGPPILACLIAAAFYAFRAIRPRRSASKTG